MKPHLICIFLLGFLSSPAYGVSLKKVANRITIHPGATTCLDLNFQGLDDLSGLSDIKHIGQIKVLSLAYNQIKTLRKKDFKALGGLLKLVLTFNPIEAIEPGTFEHLKNLVILDLQSTTIKDMEPAALNGLGSLKELILQGNPLSPETQKWLNTLNQPNCLAVYLTTLPHCGQPDNRLALTYAPLEEDPAVVEGKPEKPDKCAIS